MKIWIDKQGGTHYHKRNCPLIRFDVPPLSSLYREITIGNDIPKRGLKIYPWGKVYSPCPVCFTQEEEEE